jgi:lysophospholipase L1-like esterase
MKRILRRVLLLTASVLFTLALVEGALQFASLFVGARRDGSGWSGGGDKLHVLCIGDSNTYGLSVTREESYPGRLQQIWNEQKRIPPIEVLNIGFPGTNTSQVLRDLDRNLELFEPDVVLLEVGVNDFWTLPVETRGGASAQSLLSRLKRWSRLYRLVYITTRRGAGPLVVLDDAPRGALGTGKLEYLGETFDLKLQPKSSDADIALKLGVNVREIIARIRARNIVLALVNYSSDTSMYLTANSRLRHIAEVTKTPLIDIRASFRDPAVCPREPCPEWIFPLEHPSQAHPTAKGYALVAETVAHRLAEILERTTPAAGAARR